MVSSIGFNGKYTPVSGQYSSGDIENLAKYALGTELVAKQDNPLDGMGIFLGLGGLWEAGKLGKKLLAVHKEEGGIPKFLSNENGILINDLEKYRNIITNSEWTKWETYKTFIQKAWNKGVEKRGIEKVAETVNSEVPAKGFKGLMKTVSAFLSKYTGLSKLNTILEGAAETSPTIAKCLKCVKGNGGFLALSGGIELLTQVIPSFAQLGTGKGIKQVGKSAVKVAANLVGWEAGAAAGAAIGSIIPGAGTAVGGIIGAGIGLVCSCLGAWGAGKIADKVVGKNELEIAKEKQTEELKTEAIKNPQATQALMAATAQKLQQEGISSSEAQIAYGSLNNLAQVTPIQPQPQLGLPIQPQMRIASQQQFGSQIQPELQSQQPIQIPIQQPQATQTTQTEINQPNEYGAYVSKDETANKNQSKEKAPANQTQIATGYNPFTPNQLPAANSDNTLNAKYMLYNQMVQSANTNVMDKDLLAMGAGLA